MANHAILITWRNMETKVLADFIAKTGAKYGGNFSRVYFDGDAATEFAEKVAAIPQEDALKIYISGHGGTGILYITDDTQTRKQTVDDLIGLLVPALQRRGTSSANSKHTTVNMISCLFGRTADGAAGNTPAARLHQGLMQKGVFVDLIARTESIVATKTGRRTISILDHKVSEQNFGRILRFYKAKMPNTKVLHSYQDGAGISQVATYTNDHYIDHTSLEGRRILWADYAVNRIVDNIHLKATGLFRTGEKAVTDQREKVLQQAVEYYDQARNPEMFHNKLQRLVDGSGGPEDSNANFLIHRNLAGALGDSLPQKAGLLLELLAEYRQIQAV